MTPLKISIVEKSFLHIIWDNEEETKIKLANLRKKCPCAICGAEKSERGEKYIPIYNGEQLNIEKINIVGKYAVGISWKDGHNTGIYDFNYLRSISDSIGENV